MPQGSRGGRSVAPPAHREAVAAAFERLREELHAARPDALVVVAAEHFANFFMDNMPAYCMGMAEEYEGPIEDEAWLGIDRRSIPGNAELAGRMVESMLHHVDLAYAQEWKFDHGIMVPLHFPDAGIRPPDCAGQHQLPGATAHAPASCLRLRARAQGRVRRAAGTYCLDWHRRHFPLAGEHRTPGKINEQWDREFLSRFLANDRDGLTGYTDEETYLNAGQGGFEIRTFIAVAGATEGSTGELYIYQPIPIFAVGCTVARMGLDDLT